MSKRLVITGQVCRRSLADRRGGWHRVLSMNELDQYRIIFRFEGEHAVDVQCADYH